MSENQRGELLLTDVAHQLVREIADGKWKGGVLDHQLSEKAKEIAGK